MQQLRTGFRNGMCLVHFHIQIIMCFVVLAKLFRFSVVIFVVVLCLFCFVFFLNVNAQSSKNYGDLDDKCSP